MIFLFWIKLCLSGISPSIQGISKPCIQGLHCLNSPQSFTCNTFNNLDSNSFIKKEKDKFCEYQENNYPVEVNEQLTTEESDKIRNNLMYRGYQIYSDPQIKYCKPLRFEDVVNTATKKEKLKLKENPAIKNSENIHYNVENIRNSHKESEKKNKEKDSVHEDISSKKASKADAVKQKKPQSTNKKNTEIDKNDHKIQKMQYLLKDLYLIDAKFKCLTDSSVYKIEIKQKVKDRYLPEKIRIDLKIEKHPTFSGKMYQLKAEIYDNQNRYPKIFYSIGEIHHYENLGGSILTTVSSTSKHLEYILQNGKNQEETVYKIDNKISELFELEKNIKSFRIAIEIERILEMIEGSRLQFDTSDKNVIAQYKFIHLDIEYLKYCDELEVNNFLTFQLDMKKSFIEYFRFYSMDDSNEKNKSCKDLNKNCVFVTGFLATYTSSTGPIKPDQLKKLHDLIKKKQENLHVKTKQT